MKRIGSNRNADQWDIEKSMGVRRKKSWIGPVIGGVIIFFGLGAIGAHFSISIPTGVGHKYTIDTTKTSDIMGIDEISVDSTEANVKILSSKSDKIKVSVNGEVRVLGNYRKPQLECYKSGNTLHVNLVEKNSGMKISYSSDISMNIYVPESYKNSMEVNSSEGDVSISDLEFKNLSFNLEEGDLTAENIVADDIESSNDEGSVNARNCNTVTAKMETSESSMTLNNFKAGSLSCSSDEGDIKGSDVVTDKGTFTASEGSVNIDKFTGDIVASSDEGNVSVSYAKFNNNIKIDSSEGNVNLELPNDSKFNLAAEADEGDVSCDFPISVSGRKTENNLNGTVGKSSNDVKIKSEEGDINISK